MTKEAQLLEIMEMVTNDFKNIIFQDFENYASNRDEHQNDIDSAQLYKSGVMASVGAIKEMKKIIEGTK